MRWVRSETVFEFAASFLSVCGAFGRGGTNVAEEELFDSVPAKKDDFLIG